MLKLKKTINKIIGFFVKNKYRTLIGSLIVAVCLIGAFLVFPNKENSNNIELEDNPKNPPVEDRIVPGGDPSLVINYHEQAVSAWRSGDKERAKDLAGKGLELNEQLTAEQQSQIPSQSKLIFELYDIKTGAYEEN